jgi:quercetin dioxygenase-like cupin family protein/alkylhydroperoxidase/carboxymuconolactone decarboxylase family protein YurZ
MKIMRIKDLVSVFVVLATLTAPLAVFAGGKSDKSRSVEATMVLTKKQEALAVIGASIAMSDWDKLASGFEDGFDNGLTINEAREVAVQMYAYCGFPRSLNALNTIKKVVDERKAAGKITEEGKSNTPVSSEKTSYAIGSAVQKALFNMPQTALTRDAPSDQIINYFLRAHLFGDIFMRDSLGWKTREFVTVAALSCMPGCEAQLRGHLTGSMANGNSKAEIEALLSVISSKVSKENGERAGKILESIPEPKKNTATEETVLQTVPDTFPLGEKNNIAGKYFIGQSYVAPITKAGNVSIANVTFEPGCRNFWHIHHKSWQVLICTSGHGWYQEWGKSAQELHAGDVVAIPPETKHWHGAAKDSWFAHLAVEVPEKAGGSTEWCEPVTDAEYGKLK